MKSKRQHIDQYGNTIELSTVPQRIISLVPSQTELLYHLGLGDKVVGITKFCIHPEEWFKTKERIGGPKQLDIEKIKSLSPDLIIANKEENIKEQIEELMQDIPVWISDIYDLKDSLEMIEQVAEICNEAIKGKQMVEQIQVNFSQLKPFPNSPKALYLIWKKPYMAVAKATFIDHVMTAHLGVVNAVGDLERYPELDLNNLPETDYVFLSTEPYPFSEKHIPEIQELFPKAKILVVDGEYFTWYGSRLIGTPAYLEEVQNRM